jgi:uncharacterized protein
MTTLQESIKRKVMSMLDGREPSHDYQHILRVYKNAMLIGQQEGAIMEILLPAVLLHDLVVYPTGTTESARSSHDSADMAENILHNYGYPQNIIDSISYCIRVHSYSKQLVPATLEGRILQDADRLDALGAIGIARMFSVSGSEKRTFYRADDPFCRSSREANDSQWTLDHFHTKLLKLKDLMHTKTGKKIAEQRTKFMLLFIRQMEKEI